MAKLRLILFPFSAIYILLTEIRNFLFRINVLKTKKYDVPIISVGNLSSGGTGKTPMVLWLTKLLSENNLSVAIVSRGYGRKTSGFYWVEGGSAPEIVGDEPLLFKQKFSAAVVAVCEKRITAIDTILNEKSVDLILLDDAYQHQYVKPSLNILLSDYSKPFYSDFVLPAGNLRELRKNKNRADIIINTKCPNIISNKEMFEIFQKISPSNSQSIFFSKLNYGKITAIFNPENINLPSLQNKKIILITGIAHTNHLISFLSEENIISKHFKYPDHHFYTSQNAQEILNQNKSDTIFITTSKDAVKLREFSELKSLPLYALEIEPVFTKGDQFKELILNHVRENK